jgi:hypothetical protein
MTHDELKAKLLISDETSIYETLRLFQEALFAVVKLHKPVKGTYQLGNEYLACAACEEDTNDGAYQVEYPCPTIKAIEKELA